MQKKNICDICYKGFTRKWNLVRHIHDVHNIHDDLRTWIKQKDEVPHHLSNIVEPKRKILNKNINFQPMQYSQSYYNNNNLPNNFDYNYRDYNNTPYLYSDINSQYMEEEKKLSIDDMIKIQKVLKNLKNYLENIYPSDYIVRVIAWLRYSCRTHRSEEPLKKFLVQNNIGFLWQF